MRFTPSISLFPLINVLCGIRDAIYFGWNWIISRYSHLRIVFLISLIVASIRAAVGLFGTLFNMILGLQSTAEGLTGAMASSGNPTPGFFDKVNAIFPLAETFAFMVAYGTVLAVTTTYMFVRSLYKAIPGKAT